ncbi:sulfite exporter TauE/SafE family protein [Pantanalinema rosaneae]|uniref:sulfite exporter TauE/SafE family protein n=1 Tax=Pantanalinema rosaneae TaxID=1620701 RepID=UPI003D6FFC2C
MTDNSANSPSQNPTLSSQQRSRLAFLYAVPIATLGGLMGLGGAEFRLPVLVGVLKYGVRQAIPLNLVVSLITIVTSLLIRWHSLSFTAVRPFLAAIATLILGAVVSAFYGAALSRRLSNRQLGQTILGLLVIIGIALIIEGCLPQQLPAFLPNSAAWRVPAGILFGLVIGLVSSLLGVAGGEVIIPTLIFAFGADIKTAGSAALFVSLPTVLVGIFRYAQQGAFPDRQAIEETVVPMGIGSVIGAIVGGLLVGIVPAWLLKIGLGIILNISAIKVFHHQK